MQELAQLLTRSGYTRVRQYRAGGPEGHKGDTVTFYVQARRAGYDVKFARSLAERRGLRMWQTVSSGLGDGAGFYAIGTVGPRDV